MKKEEFIEKYGHVIVKFNYYYKFSFHYSAKLEDGSTITVGYGGDSDAIYRCEVKNNEEIAIESLYPYIGSVVKDGKEIEGFYDY